MLRGVDPGASLKDTEGPIHPDLPPGTATYRLTRATLSRFRRPDRFATPEPSTRLEG